MWLRLRLVAVVAACAAGLLVVSLASCSSEGKTGTSSGTNGTAAKSTPGAVTFGPPAERIRIEAESAELIENLPAGDTLMRVVADADASGGKCIEIPDRLGKPETQKFARAVYPFEVKVAGHYAFWCRRWWLDNCGDTFAVRFDKVGRPHSEADLFGSDDSSKPPRWDWSPVRKEGKTQTYYFTAGRHVMEILNREDGPKFDVILLINDPDYVPAGLEE